MESAWYVEYLIRNSVNIRNRVVSPTLTQYEEPAYVIDLEDDLYNDLLIVENAIKELLIAKKLTKKQKLLLKYASMGHNLSDIERLSGVSRITLSKIFTELCSSIGFRLGGNFTDAGFVEYMQEKYQLNPEQIYKLQNFLESNKRHSVGGKNAA